jgi:hypothetical protein
MVCCTVCSLWSPALGPDRLDICPDCHAQNFAGAYPPLEPSRPSARAALDAYVSIQPPPSPLQVEAMRRVHQHWEAEALHRMQARWASEATDGEDD